MLKLDTPLVFYPDSYDGQTIVRGEFDLRTQSFVLYLAPAQELTDCIALGVEDESGEEREIRFPEILRTVELRNNLMMPDRAITRVVEKFADAVEAAEDILEAEQDSPGGLATQPFVSGTHKWSLRSRAKKRGNKSIGFRKIEKE